MAELTRQQLCAELQISESTVRRLELQGLPCTPVGRQKRYDLAECKLWLREYQPVGTLPVVSRLPSAADVAAYVESSRKVRLRVRPSKI